MRVLHLATVATVAAASALTGNETLATTNTTTTAFNTATNTTTTTNTTTDTDDLLDLFVQFRQRFRKRYDTASDLADRFAVFLENVRALRAHNADVASGRSPHRFHLGLNQFSDWTPREFQAYVQRSSAFVGLSAVGSYGCTPFSSGHADPPAALDWRAHNAVTRVKDQGQCGSCWTFSSTGAMEGHWAIATGQLLDLSEQELVDCATGPKYGSHGCNGGQMEGGFKYIVEHGQCAWADYPYVSGTTQKGGDCQAKQCASVVRASGCATVPSGNQSALLAAVAKGPVAVAIEADTRYFQSYAGGVLTSASACGTNLDHGVLLVGYGTDPVDGDYWLVKNSWGEQWGEQGYIRLGRSSSDTQGAGVCGIALGASFPVVSNSVHPRC